MKFVDDDDDDDTRYYSERNINAVMQTCRSSSSHIVAAQTQMSTSILVGFAGLSSTVTM